jgi:hypothetical protein
VKSTVVTVAAVMVAARARGRVPDLLGGQLDRPDGDAGDPVVTRRVAEGSALGADDAHLHAGQRALGATFANGA